MIKPFMTKKIGVLVTLVMTSYAFLSFASAQNQRTRGTLGSLESILSQAPDLKTFLASQKLRDRYFNELQIYMGEVSVLLS